MFSRVLDCKELQAKLPFLYQIFGGQVQIKITNQLGKTYLDSVVKNKLIYFVVNFQSERFDLDLSFVQQAHVDLQFQHFIRKLKRHQQENIYLFLF